MLKSLLKTSYLKTGIAFLVFVALFVAYNVPVPSLRKVIQGVSLSLCLFLLLLIMGKEKDHRALNILLGLTILIVLVLVLIV